MFSWREVDYYEGAVSHQGVDFVDYGLHPLFAIRRVYCFGKCFGFGRFCYDPSGYVMCTL
jgi:hypothetical protein